MGSLGSIVDVVFNLFSVLLLLFSVVFVSFGLSLDCNVAELGGAIPESFLLLLALLLLSICRGGVPGWSSGCSAHVSREHGRDT